MLALQIEEFAIELKEGVVQNVGPANKSASAKLYDVTEVAVREFGDERAKLVCADDEGNEVHVALDPPEARAVARGVESLEEDSPVFE